MRFVWTCALKDLRLIRRDPVMVLVWAAIPLFLAVTLSLVFGRSGTIPQGRLLVADQDHTLLSTVLTSAFRQEPLSKMVLVEKVGLEEGRRRMNRGDASALLVIPAGFGRAYRRHQASQMELILNPSQRLVPSIIREALATTLESVPLWDTRGSVNRLLVGLDTQVIQQKPVNYGLLFFPGMVFMAFLFIAGSLGREVWSERAHGTLRRLAVTAGRLEAFLAGKLIAAAAVFSVISAVALAGGVGLVGVPMRHAPMAWLWMILSGSALYLLILLLTLYASSQRTASVLNNLVIFPLAMIGGAFFPFALMPDNFVRIGRLTPNGWALSELTAILGGLADPVALAWSFVLVGMAGAAAFLLAAHRMRYAFAV